MRNTSDVSNGNTWCWMKLRQSKAQTGLSSSLENLVLLFGLTTLISVIIYWNVVEAKASKQSLVEYQDPCFLVASKLIQSIIHVVKLTSYWEQQHFTLISLLSQNMLNSTFNYLKNFWSELRAGLLKLAQ